MQRLILSDVGNIIMLSEGRRGIDTFFTLIDGILRLEVDKATFERLGLEGKVIPTPGRKHGKVRYGAFHLIERITRINANSSNSDRIESPPSFHGSREEKLRKNPLRLQKCSRLFRDVALL